MFDKCKIIWRPLKQRGLPKGCAANRMAFIHWQADSDTETPWLTAINRPLQLRIRGNWLR